MKIAYGIDLWSRGVQSGHLDGIGVYTRELFASLLALSPNRLDIQPFLFGEMLRSAVNRDVCRSRFDFNVTAALSTFLRHSPCLNLKADTCDLFHAPDHHIPVIKSVPVVATVHDVFPFTLPKHGLLAVFQRSAFAQAIRSASAVITVSAYSADQIASVLGVPLKKIHVVHHGTTGAFLNSTDVLAQSNVCEKYKVPSQCFVFLGTLQERKNILNILRAFSDLPQVVQQRHPLLIIGKPRSDSLHISNAVRAACSDSPVFWRQDVPDDDVAALLKASLCLVFASQHEGFGLPIIEAFSLGLPVITSTTTSMPEIAGDAALLVDPLNVSSITLAMNKIAAHTELRNEYAQKGISRAKLFTWAQSATKTEHVYQAVLK